MKLMRRIPIPTNPIGRNHHKLRSYLPMASFTKGPHPKMELLAHDQSKPTRLLHPDLELVSSSSQGLPCGKTKPATSKMSKSLKNKKEHKFGNSSVRHHALYSTRNPRW
ncbi:hypothetical protein SLE2022_003650 [Rubroshorea leprosula]